MNERTYQAIIGVLVVIILLMGWWIAAHPVASAKSTSVATSTNSGSSVAQTSSTGATAASSPSTVAPTTVNNGDAVSVPDQAASSSVAVTSVTLAQPSWVAVRDASGRTLGAARFLTGTHTNVSVPLLRATAPGQNYQVLLYVDATPDHQFSLTKDILITNADGSVAGTTFTTFATNTATSTAK